LLAGFSLPWRTRRGRAPVFSAGLIIAAKSPGGFIGIFGQDPGLLTEAGKIGDRLVNSIQAAEPASVNRTWRRNLVQGNTRRPPASRF